MHLLSFVSMRLINEVVSVELIGYAYLAAKLMDAPGQRLSCTLLPLKHFCMLIHPELLILTLAVKVHWDLMDGIGLGSFCPVSKCVILHLLLQVEV